ncbi:glycoside hydrolase family protein [Rhizobium rhizogenes]|uniref:glycoside hydrolase family protein n=1 Tax=Rhizobium rhizogenes TaxID=359 RepID=UPI0015726D6A|nr:glycoside hydrolase family protein [Rhizobium rhizogenes]NTF43060.1 lysozyme [Rhizobium rhizogenes]
MKSSVKKGGAAAVATGIAMAVTTLAAPAEGYYGYVYKDPIGVLTYCYGETQNAKDMKGRTFSQQECMDLLTKRMAHYQQGNAACVAGYDNLSPYVQMAFNDFSYNLGNGTFCQSSAAAYLRAGNISAACGRITLYNKARKNGVLVELPGLTKRRALEQMYCLKGAA